MVRGLVDTAVVAAVGVSLGSSRPLAAASVVRVGCWGLYLVQCCSVKFSGIALI